MKRADMVRQGAELFFQAETSLEKTLSEVMFFGHQLGQMRLDSNLSMVIAQDQFSRVGKLIGLLTEARSEMVDLHGSLDSLRTQLGCRTVAVGNGEDKFGPTEEGAGGGAVHNLRPVVGARATA